MSFFKVSRLSMPREAHLSISTLSFIEARAEVKAAMSRSFSMAVPLVTIENSLAPKAAASLAAPTILAGSDIGYSVTPVEYLTDWAQNEQSSLQRPLLALTMEQRFTSTPR